MKTLVVNCGSSSIKYCLYEVESENMLARGQVEKIGEDTSVLSYKTDGSEWKRDVDAPDHDAAFKHIAEALMDPKDGCISDQSEVKAVGHRVVHGGEEFYKSVVVDERIESEIEKLAPLAPLHNPPNLAGLRSARNIFSDVPHVAVFDTAFHRTMPEHAYVYGLPYELYKEHGIRRYGFHGTSFRFVSGRAAKLLGVKREELSAIICHLGSGCSIAAVKDGKSVDTSMGLTPMEGLMMGTRSGDIDPGVIFHMIRGLGMSPEKVESMLNRESGFLGVSGVGNDQRVVLENSDENPRCKLALEIFDYRVRKYIGSYMAAIGKPQAIVFTAGIGERSPESRSAICAGLEVFGVKLDEKANAVKGKEMLISAPDSEVQVWVVPTNEELMIARDAAALAAGKDAL